MTTSDGLTPAEVSALEHATDPIARAEAVPVPPATQEIRVMLRIGVIVHLYQTGTDICGPAVVWQVMPGQVINATALTGTKGFGLPITDILHMPKPSPIVTMGARQITWHWIEECPWNR